MSRDRRKTFEKEKEKQKNEIKSNNNNKYFSLLLLFYIEKNYILFGNIFEKT